MSEEERKAVWDLYRTITNKDADWFTVRLYGLISKADLANKALIAKGFPLEVETFMKWQASSDPVKFFAEAGIETSRATAMGLG